MDKILPILEGLLFLSGDEGLSMEQLIGTIECDHETVESGLNQLMDRYVEDTYGIELVCFGGVYKFVSKECIHDFAEKLFTNTRMSTLSQAALETLAIIAYKQPITRNEIEEIRGVGCDMMIRKLLARSLIKECGRAEIPGRPFLYEITAEFMDAFKLESLKELPELPTMQEDMEDSLFEEI